MGIDGVGNGGSSNRANETKRAAEAKEVQQRKQGPVDAPAGVAGVGSRFEAPRAAPVALHRTDFSPASPAAIEAVAKVKAATEVYESARTEVTRLNEQLETALRTEPALADPDAAEKFREAFVTEHAAVYEAEKAAARALADTLRAAEPLVRADGARATTLDNRLSVAEGLMTLAGSSEYRQAAELAGRYGRGHDAALPREDMADVAERAALTGLREDLSQGLTTEEAMSRAGAILGVAGLGLKSNALGAIGSAIGAGADLSEFMRTGDAASLGAAGFGVLGSGAAVAAMFGGGPITIGVAGAAFLGKTVLRAVADGNAYAAAVDAPLTKALSVSPDELESLRSTWARSLAEAGLKTPELIELVRNGNLAAAGEVSMLGQTVDATWVRPLESADYDAKMAELQAAEPGLSYAEYDSRTMAALEAERTARGDRGTDALRRALAEAGLLGS